MVYKFLNKKSASFAYKSAFSGAVENENMSDKELAEELLKPIIRKFNVTKSITTFYLGCYFADIQLISKFNKGIRFLLCVIFIFSKYTWVIPLKDEKGITITNAFQQMLEVSNCNPKKIWVDKCSEFYNRSRKSWLEKNAIEMYSTYNDGKSVVAGRFISTLKNKIYKYMTSISKNVYIDKLDDTVNKYSNRYHATIKMSVDVQPSMYIDFNKENNNQGPKLKVYV